MLREKPPPGQEDGFSGCFDISETKPHRSNTQGKFQDPAQAQNLRSPRAVREAKLELLREAVHEACAFIRLHAEACQSLAEAGDNAGLIHSIGRLVIYTKHAARVGNELRDLHKEPSR
jgi:hypothetical protein